MEDKFFRLNYEYMNNNNENTNTFLADHLQT